MVSNSDCHCFSFHRTAECLVKLTCLCDSKSFVVFVVMFSTISLHFLCSGLRAPICKLAVDNFLHNCSHIASSFWSCNDCCFYSYFYELVAWKKVLVSCLSFPCEFQTLKALNYNQHYFIKGCMEG